MANQIESRVYGSVSIRQDGTVISQSASLLSVAHPGPGVFDLTFTESIGDAEEVHELCVAGFDDGEGFVPLQGGCFKSGDNTFEVQLFTGGAAPHSPADGSFSLTIWRVSSSNGT